MPQSNQTPFVSRRKFGKALSTLALGVLCQPGKLVANERSSTVHHPAETTIAIFEKILQTMPPTELADALQEMDADGIEATIRPGGRIAPEEVNEKLPKLVNELEKKNKRVLIAATNIVDSNKASRELLKALADSGVTHYRMGYYRWNKKQSPRKQLQGFADQAARLAELNRELKLTACYQNHAGDAYVGSTLWDSDQIFGQISPEQISLALDLRHLRAEVGFSWKSHIRLVQERIGYLFVKDSKWQKSNQIQNVPLGQGLVTKDVFAFARNAAQNVPLSLHVEYYGQKPLAKEKRAAAIDSFRTDIKKLRGWIND